MHHLSNHSVNPSTNRLHLYSVQSGLYSSHLFSASVIRRGHDDCLQFNEGSSSKVPSTGPSPFLPPTAGGAGPLQKQELVMTRTRGVCSGRFSRDDGQCGIIGAAAPLQDSDVRFVFTNTVLIEFSAGNSTANLKNFVDATEMIIIDDNYQYLFSTYY